MTVFADGHEGYEGDFGDFDEYDEYDEYDEVVGRSDHRVKVVAAEPEDEDDRLRLSDVAKLGRAARRRVVGAARAADAPTFAKLLGVHLRVPLAGLEVVEESWPSYDLVNVQIGLNSWLTSAGRTHEIIGLTELDGPFGLTDLLRPRRRWQRGPFPGNVTWTNLASGPDATQPAVRAGLYLVREGERRMALLMLAIEGSARLHVIADRPGTAADIVAEIRALALEHNVYRGQVISFGEQMFGGRGGGLQFHRRPVMTAADVILPAETLATIRRQVVGVAEHRDRLLAAGQHLKRGLLLYGPPGVGKTHSVRYLISQLEGVTIVQLSGDSLGLIGIACSVARTLQPAMIVVEDVDLIAEDRESGPGANPLLFQLLNEMDGLAEDADVVFLLTTNRADVLEPALATRPGRVDQAVALEMPDEDARRALFGLYRGGLAVDESRLDDVLAKTDGVTASFLKELLRRSALIAAEDGGDGGLRVSADHLGEALEELMDTRNAMTRVLLGGGEQGVR